MISEQIQLIQRFRSYLAGGGLGPTLVRALAGSAGIQIVGMAFGFLVGIQLARGLGAAGYGVYGVAMSIISLVMIPTEFGLPQLLAREIPSAQVKNDWLHVRGVLSWANRTVVALSATMAAVAAVVLVLAKTQIDSELRHTLVVGLLLVPLVALGNLRGAALRGLQHIVKGQFPEFVIRPAAFSSLLLLSHLIFATGLNPTTAMSLQVVAAAVSFIISVVLLRAVFPISAIGFPSTVHSRNWWSSAMPMALTQGMHILHGNLSLLILGMLSTVAMVGIFRVASSIGLLLSVPYTLVTIVSAPVFSRLYTAGDYFRLQLMLKWVSVFMFVGALVLTIPFFFFGQEMLRIVFGSEFSASNTCLLILGAGTLIGSIFGASPTLLNMTGHERRVTRAFGFSLLALLFCSPPLIFLWKAEGAALANSIAFVMWNILTWRDVYRLLRMDASLFSFFRRHTI